MKNNKQNFQTGVLVGVLSSFAIVGLGFLGQNAYMQYQIHQVLGHISQQQKKFADQVNQQYLSNNNGQLIQLLRKSSDIQNTIIPNLQTQDGVNFQFNQLQLIVDLKNNSKIPEKLAQHKIYYQPQSLDGRTITSWQCFSDLTDNIRPKYCLYSEKAPDNSNLLRQAILANTSEYRRDHTRSTHTPPIENDCTKFKTKLPQQFDVFATGAYSGRESNYQIDNSGHQANEMDIQVQHTRPILLILGAYEPTIWNIKWEANTHIVGVIATGYHTQKVIGLPKSIPVLETTSENSQCGYSYVSSDNASEINQLSQKILQRDIQAVVIAQNGRATIGNINSNAQLQFSQDRTMKDVIDRNAPLAGQAGIQDAIAKGLLRPATRADIDAWKAANNRAKNIHTPPVVGGTSSSGTGMEYVHFDRAYVVLKEMTMPAGLYGAHSVTIFVPEGVPRPQGNPGHSTIYEIKSGSCYGSSPDCSRR